jgi:hypothetical protein
VVHAKQKGGGNQQGGKSTHKRIVASPRVSRKKSVRGRALGNNGSFFRAQSNTLINFTGPLNFPSRCNAPLWTDA